MSLSHSSITHVIVPSFKVLLDVVRSPLVCVSSHPGPGGIQGAKANRDSFSHLHLPAGKAARNGAEQSLSKIKA